MFWTFWKKKQETVVPVTAAPEVEKSMVEKLPRPRSVEELVGRQIILELNKDPDWVWQLRSVVRRRPGGPHRFDFRVFDEAQAAVNKLKVKNYNSLDANPELIRFQGWFDKVSMEVHFEGPKQAEAPVAADAAALPPIGAVPSADSEVKIFSQNEIWQKILGLSEPGSTIFFYLLGSPASGGPLGRGAAVVELNPNYPGKKQKRYILYTADVDGLELVNKGTMFFDTDSSKELAKWIRERHYEKTKG